jgi:DNA-binding YbaB/EbfC family protein
MSKGFGGLGGFGDMAKLAKMAQKMQTDLAKAQEDLEHARIEVTAGGGAVKAIVTGKGKIVSVELQKDVVDPDDIEMLQDLIVTAIREAQQQAEDEESEMMSGMTGGMGLPPGLLGG